MDAPSPRPLRIILIDDEPEVCEFFRHFFQRRGLEVLTFTRAFLCDAYNDGPCLCKPGETCADMILTDISMPERTGLDLVALHHRMGCAAQEIAVMSGAWDEQKEAQALALGCRMFVKPVRISEITAWLAECERKVDRNRTLANHCSGPVPAPSPG